MSESANQIPLSGQLSVRLNHPSFPQPRENIKVWRYMNLAKLISLIDTNTLYLTRADKFTDPYEGTLTARTAAGIGAHLNQLGSSNRFESIRKAYQDMRKSIFVSCWHANNHESEAMWRLYCNDNDGVAIQTSYSRLVDSIEHQHQTYIGQVQYIDYEDGMFPDANMFTPFMYKRASFSHEQEVRLVQLQVNPENDDLLLERGHIPWDIQDFADNLYVNPYAPTYYYEAVKAVLRALNPSLLHKLQWSKMKTVPFI